ncbi:peptidoglycan-associated lipoprotein Pal [Psychromonas sp. Urea-02u-13]|uniref:peptidoglycan-associated lipoprotein Pal n=1 Tax=Psychromonas sp. Urea-02u-13 TaxID=2058326 RepID=UPI000C34700E|nr:peptidoglycan-associated lipoprotein Pal [Psychromonas sp. Urea-02u-13]PKG40337.1 peptidoglycan-associated lipoprotein [Psychromonas sp. Urea-02u-13]
MNLSTISKSLLIALPMLALGACSSTSDSDAESSEVNKKAATEEVAENAADNTVETDVIEAVELSEEEQLVQKYTWAILETTINFEFDKSTIAPRFTKILDAHAKFLVENSDKSLTIEGHADEKGTPEYNIALGERRANSVSTYLENMGVSASQISVVSYGEEKPVNLDHDAAAHAENRRAELTY